MPIKSDIAGTISLRALAVGSIVPLFAVLGASPASAQLLPDLCVALPGGIINCGGAPDGEPDGPTGTIDVPGALTPVTVTLEDGFRAVTTTTVRTIGGGDIVLDSLGSALIDTAGPGLLLDSSRSIFANVTGVTTAGDGAVAVVLRAVDDILFAADGTISTLGDASPAIDAQGGTVTLDLGDVLTRGIGSSGVEVISTDGPIIVTADVIETEGDLSGATILRGTGDIGLSASAIRTGGTEAAAIDISTDAGACVLLANGGCDVTAAVDEVTTGGFGSIGALVAASGAIDIDIGVLRTGGDEAAGLSLSNDPAACAVVGAGSCGTAFTINELTTAGTRSPGAVVRGAGFTTADIGLLRTEGDEAVGFDLASDPTACLILGAGACDSAFSIGELTTSGNGATGLLVRATGATTGNIGLLRTQGDDAVGADIAADPAACVLLGAGACDVGFVANEVSTQGDGAAAVLIGTAGNVVTNLGLLSTQGDDATGLGIALAPAACLVLGPGSCSVTAEIDEVDTDGDNSPGVDIDGGGDPIDVDVGEVDTDGDNSPGIDVDGAGPIDVDAGTIDTGGDNSPGIDVDGGDGPVTIDFEEIITGGDNSPGVDVDADGDVTIIGGTVSTGGSNSDGVHVNGGSGTVTVDVGAVTTTGPDSDGIDVSTGDGDQVIIAGPINVTGPGSNGIVAEAGGCGAVSIIARDDIVSADGTAILASSGCSVSVTTLPGASVAGADAGIGVTSGTGATVTIGDAVSSITGPAIDVDGAAAVVNIGAAGSVIGRVSLTDADDLFTNDGLFDAIGTSDFGGGTDRLLNRGRIRVAGGVATFANLERLDNQGLIDLVDGAANDSLVIAGDFNGGAGSRLAIDVAADVAGTPADRLVIGGAASGVTQVALTLRGGPAVANPDGVVIVDAASASAGAFTLAAPVRSGFIDYSLQARGADTVLVALPNAFALEPLVLTGVAQDFWYQSADAFSRSADLRRDDLSGGTGRDVNLWLQGYGGSSKSGGERAFDVFGTAGSADLRLDTDRHGVQGGVDIRRGGGNVAFGITGGYQSAKVDFRSGTESDLKGYNIGAYMLYAPPAGFYAKALAKVDFFDVETRNGALFGTGSIDGKSYGAEGEVGYRIRRDGMFVDLGAGLAYVDTDLDGFAANNAAFAFDGGDSLRGRLGVRVGGTGTSLAPFADAKLLHEFAGSNDSRFESGGFVLPLSDRGRGTWGRIEGGLSGRLGSAGGFVSAWGEFGDVKGYGLRAGIRF